ncbi:MAG: hypothetical protein QOG25_3799, partial [Acetobacteraceae bacterium]|nr:hypothetical protein [Acetobacteraceae bacterium]
MDYYAAILVTSPIKKARSCNLARCTLLFSVPMA